MKRLIEIDENLQNALTEYFEGKRSYVGLDNGIKLLEAVKNGKELSSLEKSNKSEILTSSTFKNGISNRTIIYQAKESKEIQEDLNKLSELNKPTTKNCELCKYYGSHHEVCKYCYKCSLWTEQEPITENCIACKYDETEGEDGKHCKKCLAGDSQFELDKEFVAPTTKNDLEVDAISRVDAIKAMQDKAKKLTNEDTINVLCGAVAILYEMPSVIPQERKGHWIEVLGGCKCSRCGMAFSKLKETCAANYCPNCGADMREVEE